MTYEKDGPDFARIPIRIEMGSMRPQHRHPRFSDDWFAEAEPPGAIYERRAQEFIGKYYPELLPQRASMVGIMREVWGSQSMLNQFHRSMLDYMGDPDADLHEFAASTRRSQERRRKRTLRERLPSVPKPRLNWRRWPWTRAGEIIDDDYWD